MPEQIAALGRRVVRRAHGSAISTLFLGLDLEILLLGTGPKQRFPHPRLTAALAAKRIGVEVMDLQAACRTYNILMAEERRVAAALLFT